MPQHEEQIDYRFVAKTVDGQEIEQMVAASNLDAAARQAWDAIQESDRNGVELASAKLEWDDVREGPQVEYLYDWQQGIETYRPDDITLGNERRIEDQLRQELRADFERRQEWNGIIKEGSVSAETPSMQDLKSPAEMTKAEIVTEARELHGRFSEMMGRFETMQSGAERALLREDMKPLAVRENELREEYTGRLKTEMARNPSASQNRAMENEISYSR